MEHFRALAALTEAPVPEHQHVARALGLEWRLCGDEHSDIFLFQLFPYAAVYLGPEGMLGGEARDRIAGFWRALTLDPPAEPDHLAVMLALHARLGELEEASGDNERPAWRRARHAHLWEHLMSWLPTWLEALDSIAPEPYRAWGRLLASALAEEAQIVGPPAGLPQHLATAPAVADPRTEGLDAFVSTLLAPARSGVILARADLARAATELGLGLRAGERRYALRNLLAQDAPATLAWLCADATQWVTRHRAAHRVASIVADHWIERADRTAGLLTDLHAELEEIANVAGAGD
jgi:hypothetical protein